MPLLIPQSARACRMSIPFPWDPEPLEPAAEESVKEAFPDYREDGVATYGPSRYLAVPDSKPFFQQYYNTPVHDDDVWVVTLPKSGG